jgi:hypothetical protein
MINLSLLQIILAALSVVMILQGIIRYAKHIQGQTFFKVTLSTILWAGILTFTLFPASSHVITNVLGFGENLNTLIFIGFVVTFFVIAKIIRVIERVERNISEIIRKEALSKLEK